MAASCCSGHLVPQSLVIRKSQSSSRSTEVALITPYSVVAKGNTLLGGINLVDHGPFGGDYTGVVISGNTIRTEDAMIKIGVAVGLMVWGTYNDTSFRTFGASITGNNFVSNGGTGYFTYGMSVRRITNYKLFTDSHVVQMPDTITPS